MRTTVTLDPDVEALIKRTMRERGQSFKDVINISIRIACGPSGRTVTMPYQTPAFDLSFYPGVNLDKALQLAGELEDQEIMRKMRLGK